MAQTGHRDRDHGTAIRIWLLTIPPLLAGTLRQSVKSRVAGQSHCAHDIIVLFVFPPGGLADSEVAIIRLVTDDLANLVAATTAEASWRWSRWARWPSND